ncbi:MAG: hypothetical protein EB051_04400 [Chlamydiia bacterium]|nr:hypothetical protein [Chlamydiia bacterium]
MRDVVGSSMGMIGYGGVSFGAYAASENFIKSHQQDFRVMAQVAAIGLAISSIFGGLSLCGHVVAGLDKITGVKELYKE